MFGMTIPRLDADGIASLLRSRGADVPECKDDDEATAYFKKQKGPKGGEHYLKVAQVVVDEKPVTKKELRVYIGKEWILQVTR